MTRGITNLEDILELFASRYRRCNVDDSGDALKCVGEIPPCKVLDDDDVDLVTVLGIRLLQRVSLSRPHDSNGVLATQSI